MPTLFAEKLLIWADNNSSDGLLSELCQRWFDSNKTYPDTANLWKNIFHEILPLEYKNLYYKQPGLFNSVLIELNHLPNIPQVSDVSHAFESKMPGWATYPDKSAFCERIIKFHSEIPKWLDGTIHASYQHDKIKILLLTQEKFMFSDLWSCARFLTNSGLQYPTSIKGYHCWKKYSSDATTIKDSLLEWFEVLSRIKSDWDQVLLLDKKINFILDSYLTLDLKSLCKDRSSCSYCPLCSDCHFFSEHHSDDHLANMENLIKLKRSEEIKKVDLLAFLAGERCQFTEQEVQLIKSFPNLPQDSLQNGNPQTTEQLYIFLQGLVELFHRTNLETYKSKGDSFTESRHIAKYVSHLLSREKQEYFYILILDNKNRVIRNHRVSQGLLNKSLVHPREVFAPALELRAASIVLIHNHPSGDTSPSVQDRTITKRLCEVGNLTGINVIDHLIIGDETYFSFVDHGIMPFVD